MWVWILLGVGAALAVWAVWRLAVYARPARAHQQLFRFEAAFVESAAAATFPAGGDLPPGGEAEIPGFVDRYVAALPAKVRVLMHLLFLLMEQATLIFPAPGATGWRRFSSLSEAQQIAALEGWRTSRFFVRRLVFTSLRAILCMGYFAHPVVLRKLRLAPYQIDTPIVEADLLYPVIGRTAASIAYQESDLTPPSDGAPIDIHGPLHPDYAEAGS